MYTEYFGLNEKPFSITPDPRYLFMSTRHSEGLAHLVYGVKDSSGFIQLTGEVGTGKTTLVRTLLARIPSGVDVALILNPQLSALEFLSAICEELKVPLPDERGSTKALVDSFNRHLLASHAEGRRTILLVDEAQNLSTEVLEQIRLLTNLETAKQKLLQIILIAQPELREKLSQSNLRQLAQRVTGRYHLEPLSKEDTMSYIDHRLKVAGGLGDVFDERAKRAVYRFSKGVPRLINVICDRALLGAYSLETARVSPQIVRKAASEISGEKMHAERHRWLMPGVGLLVSVAMISLWAMNRVSDTPSVDTITIPLQDSGPTGEPATDAVPAIIAEAITEQESLDSLLRQSAALTTTGVAMATLLSIWNIDYDSSAGTACSQAEARGLSCLTRRGSWSVLRQMDRPVVITLTDSSGQTHQPVVVSTTDESAELLLGDQRIMVSVAEISELWFGSYLLLWRPPTGDPRTMRAGERGPKILWLRRSLAALDQNSSAAAGDSDLFDKQLEQRLMAFQLENRLLADGLAGQQTQIVINSQLGGNDTPRLSGN